MTTDDGRLFATGTNWQPPAEVADHLASHHYLGATRRGIAWRDEYGIIVLAKPTSRQLPADGTWLELTRWCLNGTKNGGSRQWAQVTRALRNERPEVTTIISYSDPSAGHTGALYKSSNWIWCPTWHRICPPPSGNGQWRTGVTESVKDRWCYPLRPDDRRDTILQITYKRASVLMDELRTTR